jgi:hypothetical protein
LATACSLELEKPFAWEGRSKDDEGYLVNFEEHLGHSERYEGRN